MLWHWTDSRDGSEWEIVATPLMGQIDPGDPVPMIGETPYALWFSSRFGASYSSVVEPDVGSRLSELLDAEMAALLDAAKVLPREEAGA
jgi:hypothetical protein